MKPSAADREIASAFLTSVCPFSAEELDFLLAKLHARDFKSGWSFSVQGGPSDYFGYILKGLFKLERLTDRGQLHIVDFCSEGSIISNYTAWLEKAPADLTIQALEPGRILLLPIPDYEELFARIPRFNEFVRKILERDVKRLAERECTLLTASAEERYRIFLKAHHKHVGRLMGKDIAAYLGITPVSLSRLRARRAGGQTEIFRPTTPRGRGGRPVDR